jgi:hypothetical protein
MPTNAGSQTTDQSDDHMHGAAIIDDTGKETPITDDMIEKALQGILKTTQT